MEQTHEGEYLFDDGDIRLLKITRPTKLFAFCAELNSCNLAFDIRMNTGTGLLAIFSSTSSWDP